MFLRQAAVLIVLAALLAADFVVGQETPAAAPHAFRSPEAIHARLHELARHAAGDPAGPRVTVEEIGVSLEGRPILVLGLGEAAVPTPLPGNAPGAVRRTHDRVGALLVVAGLEADRPASSEVVLGVVERLLARDDDALRAALGGHALYVIPCANPDGLTRTLLGIAEPGRSDGPRALWDRRGNARPLDWDRDGRTLPDRDPPLAEDVPRDLNADGLILRMRVEDPRGTLIADPDDERFLRAADEKKGERGRYRVWTEGRDEDGDGACAENPAVGVEVNRNFPHGFAEHDLASGVFPTSEPEALALVEFVLAHQNIEQVLVYGAHDNLAKVPEAQKSGGGRREAARQLHQDDRPLWEAIAKMREEHVPTRVTASLEPAGAFHEWAYFQFGVPAFAVNIFEVPDEPWDPKAKETKRKPREKPEEPVNRGDAGSRRRRGGEAQDGDLDATIERIRRATPSVGHEGPLGPDTDDAAGVQEEGAEPGGGEAQQEAEQADPVQEARERVYAEGFVPWTTFEHPELGTVEIGGWRPLVRMNPPVDLLPLVIDREAAFVEDLLGRFAAVRIERFEARPLATGLYELTATIVNEGALPTATHQGVRTRVPGPVIVELQVTEDRVLQGDRRDLIDRLEARAGSKNYRWLLRGEPGSSVELVVGPPKSGAIGQEVTLP